VYPTGGTGPERVTLDRGGAAVTRPPFAPGLVTDVAGERLAFVETRENEPWIGLVDPAGTHHFLIRAVFTPGRTALLVSRRVVRTTHVSSEPHRYYLADDRTRRPAVLPDGFLLRGRAVLVRRPVDAYCRR
jgi:hypothetical protein